jgi:hypothetical protein
MKLRFTTLIVATLLIFSLASPASGTLIIYTDKDTLLSTFENDPDFIFDEESLNNLVSNGYENEWLVLTISEGITLHGNSLEGTGTLLFDFKQPNTTFGATWLNDTVGTSFEVLGNTYYIPVVVNGGGNPLNQFFGVRGDDDEMIEAVMVNLVGGASISGMAHNNPVPEPATMLLLGTGLIGLAGFRKKFKKS